MMTDRIFSSILQTLGLNKVFFSSPLSSETNADTLLCRSRSCYTSERSESLNEMINNLFFLLHHQKLFYITHAS